MPRAATGQRDQPSGHAGRLIGIPVPCATARQRQQPPGHAGGLVYAVRRVVHHGSVPLLHFLKGQA